MRVLVLTTSYPRDDEDFAGRFLADTVDRLRSRGLEVELLAPGRGYSDYGLAYGEGMSHNVRRRPWAVPALLASMTRAARRAARRADVVHAHWLPTGFPAAFAGKPVVLTLARDRRRAGPARSGNRPPDRAQGDRRHRRLAGAHPGSPGPSGAREARFVPNGVEVPAPAPHGADQSEVLFAGRLSPEKGIEDLLAVADGLQLVVAGDGPLRPQVPQALGMVPRGELYRLLDRAAVVAFPSRRDGFPVTCAEAMAHGRAVVATAVGGLPDMIVDEETGLLVPPGDGRALRAAIDRLLADPALRSRLGAGARARIEELCGWERVIDQTVAVYEAAARSSG